MATPEEIAAAVKILREDMTVKGFAEVHRRLDEMEDRRAADAASALPPAGDPPSASQGGPGDPPAVPGEDGGLPDGNPEPPPEKPEKPPKPPKRGAWWGAQNSGGSDG